VLPNRATAVETSPASHIVTIPSFFSPPPPPATTTTDAWPPPPPSSPPVNARNRATPGRARRPRQRPTTPPTAPRHRLPTPPTTTPDDATSPAPDDANDDAQRRHVTGTQRRQRRHVTGPQRRQRRHVTGPQRHQRQRQRQRLTTPRHRPPTTPRTMPDDDATSPRRPHVERTPSSATTATSLLNGNSRR
jgi:hypothetical protein